MTPEYEERCRRVQEHRAQLWALRMEAMGVREEVRLLRQDGHPALSLPEWDRIVQDWQARIDRLP